MSKKIVRLELGRAQLLDYQIVVECGRGEVEEIYFDRLHREYGDYFDLIKDYARYEKQVRTSPQTVPLPPPLIELDTEKFSDDAQSYFDASLKIYANGRLLGKGLRKIIVDSERKARTGVLITEYDPSFKDAEFLVFSFNVITLDIPERILGKLTTPYGTKHLAVSGRALENIYVDDVLVAKGQLLAVPEGVDRAGGRVTSFVCRVDELA